MRSAWLFVPGHEPYKIRKALSSPADVVIVDWEDGVPHDQKEAARRETAEVLASSTPSRRIVVRINSPKTPWFADDLPALHGIPVSAIITPKAEDPAAIDAVASAGLPIIPLVESALGVEQAFALARAHPLIERLALGPLDLLADIGARWTPQGEAISYARARLVIATRAAGLDGLIDGVYPHLTDLEGLRREATLARTVGCAGKMLLHPRQIEVVREAFQPSRQEVEQAQLIVKAAQDAAQSKRSAIQVDGLFIDPPIVRQAYQTLQSLGEMSGG
jgi:citrate lyase subunit beta/citryl-CoA lyase